MFPVPTFQTSSIVDPVARKVGVGVGCHARVAHGRRASCHSQLQEELGKEGERRHNGGGEKAHEKFRADKNWMPGQPKDTLRAAMLTSAHHHQKRS